MAFFINNRKKKSLLALLLSSTMVFSTVVGLAACDNTGDGDDNTTDTSTPATEADTARILNGSFEFLDDNKGRSLIVTSVNNWTKTNNSAATETTYSSLRESGIVNTDEKAWKNLTESALPEGVIVSADTAKAEQYWSTMSAYDKLEFYDAWKRANKDGKLEDLSFYNAETDDFNIDFDDVPLATRKDEVEGLVNTPLANPLTHDWKTDGTAEEQAAANKDKDTNVLMLQNYYTDNRGTAQKYTSSTTVTVQAGTSAQVSLWVKTSALTYANSYGSETKVQGNRGAYIGITHSVGSKTLDQMQIKNIDTEAYYTDKGAIENNGWVNYTFYLKGCAYSNSTFTMVLGLGQADGSTFEFVNGFAFFDDVECKLITNADYEKALAETETVKDDQNNDITIPVVDKVVTINDKGDDKALLADETSSLSSRGVKGKTEFALDLYEDLNAFDFTNTTIDTSITVEELSSGKYAVANDGKNTNVFVPENFKGNNAFDVTSDLKGVYTLGNDQDPADGTLRKLANSDELLASILEKDFKNHAKLFNTTDPNDPNKEIENPILMMLSKNGANYTMTLKDDSFVLKAGEKMAISFFAKTSELRDTDKFSAVVLDKNGAVIDGLKSLDLSNVQTVDIEDTEDIYDGWQQCFFFICNDTEEDGLEFSLRFTLGKTSNIYNSKKSDYHSGYAAMTGFKVLENMTQTQFDCVSTGNYSTNVLLKVDRQNRPMEKDSFDTAVSLPIDQIKEDIATPANYKGVEGGSGYVNNTSNNNKYNTNPYAGLINKNYTEKYAEKAAADSNYWAAKLGLTTKSALDAFFGDTTQPLLIYNNVEQAYGFIGNKQTLSANANAPTAISLKIKASMNAKVNVLLADMDDHTRQSALSIGRGVTYWYDDDGNVCTMDPKDKDFNKRTNVAFKLQSNNGLYKAVSNANVGADANRYYFNLANYEYDEDTGNLLVKKGGVSYDYTNAWKHDGNDGIAFYGYDAATKTAYADSAKTIKVYDFATTNLAPRYDAKAAQDLSVTLTGTGEWQIVTFYLVAGSEAKNYRLEIWSGSRDGEVKNAPGSYVLIASYAGEGVADKAAFTTTAETEYIQKLVDAYNADPANVDNQLKLKDVQENTQKFKDAKTTETYQKYFESFDLFYSTFSFYDSNTFLRYDQSLDANGVGNSYDDYTSSTYTKELAYLKATVTVPVTNTEKQSVTAVFANFSTVEQSPSVDVDTSTDDDTTDEEEDNTSGTDIWLLASSLLIVVALLVAIVALIIRKATAKARKKKAQAAMAQPRSAKNRRYTKKK